MNGSTLVSIGRAVALLRQTLTLDNCVSALEVVAAQLRNLTILMPHGGIGELILDGFFSGVSSLSVIVQALRQGRACRRTEDVVVTLANTILRILSHTQLFSEMLTRRRFDSEAPALKLNLMLEIAKAACSTIIYLADKLSISSKSKFSRSLHRRGLREGRTDGNAVCGTAFTSPSAMRPSRMSRLLAQLMSWLPPSASLHALTAAIRRILLGKGWQHANAVAVLLLKLRPLLFCALYAAGQKWAAWAGCIACDITAIKLVSAAHAHGMEDSNAKAAVVAAANKWHWYMLRNPFYNVTVGKFASVAAEGTSGVPIVGAVVDMVTAPLLHVGKYYFHTSFS